MQHIDRRVNLDYTDARLFEGPEREKHYLCFFFQRPARLRRSTFYIISILVSGNLIRLKIFIGNLVVRQKIARIDLEF